MLQKKYHNVTFGMICNGVQNKTTVDYITKLWHKCGKIIFFSLKWQISVNIFKYCLFISKAVIIWQQVSAVANWPVQQFSKSRVLDKVPEESTLIFEDTKFLFNDIVG